jgi:hypothetical protein
VRSSGGSSALADSGICRCRRGRREDRGRRALRLCSLPPAWSLRRPRLARWLLLPQQCGCGHADAARRRRETRDDLRPRHPLPKRNCCACASPGRHRLLLATRVAGRQRRLADGRSARQGRAGHRVQAASRRRALPRGGRGGARRRRAGRRSRSCCRLATARCRPTRTELGSPTVGLAGIGASSETRCCRCAPSRRAATRRARWRSAATRSPPACLEESANEWSRALPSTLGRARRTRSRERFGVCREIALHKREHGIPMRQPGRVQEVRARDLFRGAEAGFHRTSRRRCSS